jgi:single-strand DNA-binding protein
MNKVVLMGRLAQDPEVRYTQNSAEPLAVARYSLAVNRRYKREGESDADFIPCVAFGKAAEFAERFFKKGMMVAVSGRIQVRSWEDQQGQKRWSTEVILEDQEFAESKASFEGRMSGRGEQAPKQQSGGYDQDGFAPITESIDDDDLPF